MKNIGAILLVSLLAQSAFAFNYVCLGTAVPEITNAEEQAGQLPPIPNGWPLIINGPIGTMGAFTIQVRDASLNFPRVTATVRSLKTGQSVTATSNVLPGTPGQDMAQNLILDMSEAPSPLLISPAQFQVHCYIPTAQ